MTGPPAARPASPVVWRNSGFVIFAVTQAVSLFGDKLDYMALLAMVAWFADRFGRDGARMLSVVPVVTALPAMLFSPLAGVIADRWDRRAVMVVSDSARAVLVPCVPLLALATGSPALVYLLAFLTFMFGVFFQAARLATIPNIVGRDRVLGANSVMSAAGRVATMLGVLIGGIIVDWPGWSRVGIHPPWAAGFYIDALTYAASVVALLVVYRSIAPQERTPRAAPRAIRHSPRRSLLDSIGPAIARRAGHVITDLREALVLARQTPAVLFVYCSVLLFVFVGAAWLVLYVPVIQGRAAGGLGLGTRGVGYVGAFGAAGLLLSTAAYGVIRRVPKHRVMLGCFVVIGGAVAGLAFARRFEHVAPLTFVAGLGVSPLYVGMDTLIHETVPDAVRGRVFSSRDWLMHLAFALFALAIGQATRLLPNRSLLLAAGLITVIAAVFGLLATRRRAIA